MAAPGVSVTLDTLRDGQTWRKESAFESVGREHRARADRRRERNRRRAEPVVDPVPAHQEHRGAVAEGDADRASSCR